MSDEPQGRTYEQAVERLEQIIQRLDSGEAELRETLALCTEAKELIVFCRGELEAAVRGHEPQRTLERGYALVESADGDAVTTAEAARAQRDVRVRFADDAVRARIEDQPDE